MTVAGIRCGRLATSAARVLPASILAALALAVSPSIAATQDAATRTGIQQMNPDAPGQAEATGAAQVAARPAPPLVSGPVGPVDRAVAGSAPSPTGPVPYSQLTTEAATAEAGVVVPTEGPNVGPAPSAAARALGRVTRVSTPDGPDRCDPQSPRAATVACDRVIEARAGEFSTPDHQPLSAEQRLLATQRPLRPQTNEVGTAMRRLVNGEPDDSVEALAIASVALSRPVQPAREEEPAADTTALDAIVAGITTLVTGMPPNP